MIDVKIDFLENMDKIADIVKTQRGNIKVKFYLDGIYYLLKNKLGYRFTSIKGKGYYLKENKNGLFEIQNFFNLPDDFRGYVYDNFDTLKINGEIDLSDFMNAYYDRLPIRNGSYGKSFLRKDFELTAYNKHLILMEIDSKYRKEYEMQEMYTFLKNNNFKEDVDKIGNFSLEKPIFYKRLTGNTFLIFTRPFFTKKNNDQTFDFYKVKVRKEKSFLKEKLDSYSLVNLRLGFNLERDIDLYNKVIDNVS